MLKVKKLKLKVEVCRVFGSKAEAKQCIEQWAMECMVGWSAWKIEIGEVEYETMRHLVGGDHLRCVST